MTTFLTKAQRQILIDWYIESLIDTESEFVDLDRLKCPDSIDPNQTNSK
jgi:hypothetical protein